jgi:hypothetical protein
VSYQVRPEDVVILDQHGNPRPPQPTGAAAWIRRHRLLLALALGIVVALTVIATGAVSQWALLAVELVLAFLYLRYRAALRPRLVREVAWVLVFGLGVAVMIPALVTITKFTLIVIGVVLLLILMMMLLGDRHR